MTNKCLTIENLDNLQELNAEEVFSIQGGGLVKEIYDDINEIWSDIKKGVVDAFSEN